MKCLKAMAVLDRKILEAFSRRTVESLRRIVPLRLALPRMEGFLALNVAKEVEKDALVLRRAGEDFATGTRAGDSTATQLFSATKDIDRAFLARADRLPVEIVICYDEIAPFRTQRIDRLLTAAYRVLDAGQLFSRCRSAIQSAYSRVELERLLHDLLRLYALETRVLSRSLQLPSLLVPLRERLAHAVYESMTETAVRLAREATACAYRPGRC